VCVCVCVCVRVRVGARLCGVRCVSASAAAGAGWCRRRTRDVTGRAAMHARARTHVSRRLHGGVSAQRGRVRCGAADQLRHGAVCGRRRLLACADRLCVHGAKFTVASAVRWSTAAALAPTIGHAARGWACWVLSQLRRIEPPACIASMCVRAHTACRTRAAPLTRAGAQQQLHVPDGA
jgi:hypothetical protein